MTTNPRFSLSALLLGMLCVAITIQLGLLIRVSPNIINSTIDHCIIIMAWMNPGALAIAYLVAGCVGDNRRPCLGAIAAGLAWLIPWFFGMAILQIFAAVGSGVLTGSELPTYRVYKPNAATVIGIVANIFCLIVFCGAGYMSFKGWPKWR